MRNSILSLRNVTKIWKNPDGTQTAVLQNVSFSLDPGQSIAIMGSSGSGKTTCLSISGALDMACEGEVLIAGKDVRHMRVKDIDRMRAATVGFVLQRPFLLQELDLVENVVVARDYTKEGRERAKELLDTVGIEESLFHLKPSFLSPGQAQRVAVARALWNTPKLLICDEPTASLDSMTAQKVIALIMAYVAQQKTALLLATHDHRVAEHVEFVYTLADGRCVLHKN